MATHSSTLDRRIPVDSGAWWATVYGVAKSQTLLTKYRDHYLNFCFFNRSVFHTKFYFVFYFIIFLFLFIYLLFFLNFILFLNFTILY